MSAPAPRQLRADAARNAERIVHAGRRAFAELGADVSLAEIARRAGLGVATLYRHFPSKDDLILAIFEWHYADQVEPAINEALADGDPWQGMVTVLEAALRLAAEEKSTFVAARDPARVTSDLASRFFSALSTIVRRAQQAGLVRAALEPGDLPRLVTMLVSTLRQSDESAQVWRRYLALLLDAFRPAAATPLPPASQS
jgi:AcrR family transcriptional regulator